MKKSSLVCALAFASFFLLASAREARAANYIVYLQGRGWSSWDTMQSAAASGWTNVYLPYNGNAALGDASTIATINGALKTYCQAGNVCVLHCYSAGCLRMQKAVSDLRAQGQALSGLLWAQGSGSAAGGTHLAELATQGGTSFLAKLLGQQEKIDFDLTPSAARGHYQYDFGKTMYLVAGNQDICKGFWIFKLCGNAWVDPSGVADGVVPMASAGGCSAASGVSDYASCAKYPYHAKENRVTNVPNGGEPFDHFGMPNDGSKVVQVVLTSSAALAIAASWSSANGLTHTACINAGNDCDDKFYTTAEDFSKKPDGTTVAPAVNALVSNTTRYTDTNYLGGAWQNTCNGHCGGSNATGGSTCYCDGACTARGDCCADYSYATCTGKGYASSDCTTYNSQCDVVNAQ